MSAPTKLFLDYNEIDEQWKILSPKGGIFGSGETPEAAICSARVVSDAPIYANSDFKGIIDYVLDVPTVTPDDLDEDTVIYSKEELIEVMAELGGFNVKKVYDKHNFLLGYVWELKE